ncbi:MAG TPA: hypothetical protein VK734_02615 [Bradyrhizobium sp.]|nr:hypothetical protein [Bradyrhizobium sp.]
MSKRTITCACMLAALLGSASTLGAQETRKPGGGVINPDDSGGARHHMNKTGDSAQKAKMSKDTLSKKDAIKK